MTVLIVAPPVPDLPLVTEEAAALANALDDPVLLQGEEASVRGIINAVAMVIAAGGRVVGFWFAGHGSVEGLVFPAGVLSPISLAGILNTAGAVWVVLNTCDSRALVGEIQLRAGVDVIATETADIKDAAAWEFGRLLAIEYGRTGDMKKSVLTVARGSDRHRYYEYNGRVLQMPDRMQAETLSTDEKLNLLVGRIIGDKWRGVPGLVDTVAEINAGMTALRTEMSTERKEREQLADIVQQNQKSNDTRFSTLTIWIWLTLVGLGLVIVVQIVMIMVLARP